jgi:hypothetical protein
LGSSFIAQLFWRSQVKPFSRLFIDLFFGHPGFSFQLPGIVEQEVGVDLDAFEFHIGEDFHQRVLDLIKDLFHDFGLQLGKKDMF